MSLIIDGYNLLHASGIIGGGKGPGSLERSRGALLNFLVESLSDRELPTAIIVFDAAQAPPGLPRITSHRGLAVQFASPHHADADELIEELIRADASPRRLVVVSSDHRLHRAANRRKATAIDSDKWFAERLRARLGQHRGATAEAPKPAGPLSSYEVARWLRDFGLEPVEEQAAFEDPPSIESAASTSAAQGASETLASADPPPTHKKRTPGRRRRPASPDKPRHTDLPNPFPPGYAEDLLDGE
jgi:predicted RNA-binding protein with PIN domain